MPNKISWWDTFLLIKMPWVIFCSHDNNNNNDNIKNTTERNKK